MTKVTSLNNTLLNEIFDKDELLTEAEQCYAYGFDNSLQHHLPDAVIIPHSIEQIQKTIHYCQEKNIAFTTRGRGSCTTGAAVPVKGGIVCSMENFNKILEINTADRYVVVQAGCINQDLQNELAKHGFFWAPDPTSSAYSTIGGNLACCAGGPRAVKYGTCRENTLGLQAITGTGELINTGVYTTKGVVGYDLTRLFIGSEGTLGLITEATLKITPLCEAKATLQAFYKDIPSSTEAVAAIMRQPETPCALEFIDTHCINIIRNYSDAVLPEEAGALLMIEVDGPKASLDNSIAAISKAATNNGLLSLTAAQSIEEIKALWKTRKALSPAMRKIAPKKINEDVVVPVSNIPALIAGLDELSKKHGIPIVNFGHAGNGNIHTNLMIDTDNKEQVNNAEACLDEVFSLVLKLKGTLSGEHGIGLIKKEFVNREIDANCIQLMKAIKKQFDPQGIMNPEKILAK